jgi:hypothetical protein
MVARRTIDHPIESSLFASSLRRQRSTKVRLFVANLLQKYRQQIGTTNVRLFVSNLLALVFLVFLRPPDPAKHRWLRMCD